MFVDSGALDGQLVAFIADAWFGRSLASHAHGCAASGGGQQAHMAVEAGYFVSAQYGVPCGGAWAGS